MKKILQLTLINILILSLIIAGFAYGIVAPLYINDISYITYLITIIMSFILISSEYITILSKDSTLYLKCYKFLSRNFLLLGLFGTLIGLSSLMMEIKTGNGASTEVINGIISAIKGSMQTTFNATMMGIVAKLWTNLIVFIIDNEEN